MFFLVTFLAGIPFWGFALMDPVKATYLASAFITFIAILYLITRSCEKGNTPYVVSRQRCGDLITAVTGITLIMLLISFITDHGSGTFYTSTLATVSMFLFQEGCRLRKGLKLLTPV